MRKLIRIICLIAAIMMLGGCHYGYTSFGYGWSAFDCGPRFSFGHHGGHGCW